MRDALLVYLAVVNLLAFGTFGWDKLQARSAGRRIPEARLLWLAFLLGAPGAWIGSSLFRHKTVKKSFRRKLVLVTVLELLLVLLLLRLGYGPWRG